ncbi:MFS transporter [Qaidamihabitans albus]|uniref:MFS transporter n=1 Tax=Qaidamihabitans albus TaxID=2795733 RepID=UPI001B354FBA|nr:MFS transporter [Qaidamihabitans albus]
MTNGVLARLRDTGYPRWSVAAQFGRLPSAVAPLAFTILTTATTGSYRLGGVMMAVFVAAELLGAVPAGRFLDRAGPRRGMVLLLAGAAAGFAALTVAAAVAAPGGVLLALVAVPGLLAGGLAGGLRSLLAGAVPDELLPRAVAVDAMLIDGVLIAGPLLAALLASVHALAPPAVMTLAYVACAALLPRGGGTAVVAPEGARLPVRAAAGWLACVFAIGHLLATIEVAPLPLAGRLGAGEVAAALIVAVLCGSSIAGSAVFAWRGRTTPVAARVFLGVFVGGGVLVSLDLGWPGLLAGVVLVGACTGPLLTVATVNLQRLLPPGRRSEGFSVAFAVQATGFALGSLSVGLLPLALAPLLGAGSAALACAMLSRTER